MVLFQLVMFNEEWLDECVFVYLIQFFFEGVNGDFYVLYYVFKYMCLSDYE